MDTIKDEDNATGGLTGTIIGLVIFIVLGFWAYNTWLKPATWEGLYEVTSDNAIHSTGKFASREECAEWLQDYNPRLLNKECGSNCEPPATAIGAYRCDETF